jgi:hypothetical protein
METGSQSVIGKVVAVAIRKAAPRGLFVLALLMVTIAPSVAAEVETTASFTLPSGIAVAIIEAPFEPAVAKIDKCSDGGSICRINGNLPFGAAGDVPQTYVKRITVAVGGKSYDLSAADMYNAWGSRPLKFHDLIQYFGGNCKDQKNCRFRGLFSDAAGAFVAEWQIVDGISVRTILTNSPDVMNLFVRHIEPPDFVSDPSQQ